MESDEFRIKSWEELTLADNFIFQRFMQNEAMCKKVLSEIFEKEVVDVSYRNYEETLDFRLDAKSIRLDVYVKNESEVYNVEIQNRRIQSLPKRGRYYQALIDMDLIEKGQEYDDLNRSYVIFICTFDPYDKGLYKYTFQSRCEEVEGLYYGDETTKIVLNTKGKEGNISEDLKIFLESINGIFSGNKFSANIKMEYEKVKHSREWRREYMTLEMELMEQRKYGEKVGRIEGEKIGRIEGEKVGRIEGEKVGRIEGERNIMTLIKRLTEDNRLEDIKRIAEDEEYLKDLLKEYGIDGVSED